MNARSFLVADSRLRNRMLNEGKKIHPARWQGIDISQRPDAAMVELLNVGLEVDLRGIESLAHWRTECQPNLPWADDHFEERVSRKPLNPPPSWAWWPWARSADKFRADEKFNHTYPERYWPRFAGEQVEAGVRPTNVGIRGEYGDLDSVVDLMLKDPLTRQAYLPIFFPEDTGVGDGGRKPCTLGYQFIVRPDYEDGVHFLHLYYPMRSCDLLRHFRDDCYLTVRLGIWLLEQLREKSDWSSPWDTARLGTLSMHMTSLHCFVGDYMLMKHETEKSLEARLMGGL